MTSFVILAILMCIGSIQVIRSTDAVKATGWLAMTLTTTAAAYIHMNAPFAAGAQFLLYSGVISILILGTIGTISTLRTLNSKVTPARWIRALLIAGGFLFLAASAIRSGDIPQTEPFVHDGTTNQIIDRTGHLLFTWHMGALEAFALVLLCAMVGALLLIRRTDA